jgi:hypothetical protein
MSFYDVECLTFEDRKSVVEIISNIKKEEKESIDKTTSGSRVPSTPPKTFPKTHKYSSVNNKFKAPFRAPYVKK